MLGNAVFRVFSEDRNFSTVGTVRSQASLRFLPNALQKNIQVGVDVENFDDLVGLFAKVKPELVVNCIGLVKQLSNAEDPVVALPINSIFPHRLARLCGLINARIIHLSTDCVFSGDKGMYSESDLSDARDLYGKSKFIGEVDYEGAVTLRTSIIGHELNGNRSLVDWFLSQQHSVRGFKRAIFSGLPTVELARLMRDYVVPNSSLRGVYHVSSGPINKFDLLTYIADVYEKDIVIEPDENFSIDRSLDSSRFKSATGFVSRSWIEMIQSMREFG